MGVYGSPDLSNMNNDIDWIKKMIYCHKCGTRDSKKFRHCPKCRAKTLTMFYNKWWFWLFVFFFILIVFGSISPQTTVNTNTEIIQKTAIEPIETPEEFKAKCINISYSDLARNPNSYVGQYAVFTGKVVQVQENGKNIVLRVNVNKDKYGIWNDTIYVDYNRTDPNESRILEDDIITMYGNIMGIKTYETVFGNSVSIPHLSSKYININ